MLIVHGELKNGGNAVNVVYQHVGKTRELLLIVYEALAGLPVTDALASFLDTFLHISPALINTASSQAACYLKFV